MTEFNLNISRSSGQEGSPLLSKAAKSAQVYQAAFIMPTTGISLQITRITTSHDRLANIMQEKAPDSTVVPSPSNIDRNSDTPPIQNTHHLKKLVSEMGSLTQFLVWIGHLSPADAVKEKTIGQIKD